MKFFEWIADQLNDTAFYVACAVIAAFAIGTVVGAEGARAECAVCVRAN